MMPIEGYEGRYSITEDGDVYSHSKNKYISKFVGQDGRLMVSLQKNGRGSQRKFNVLNLVARAFVKKQYQSQTCVIPKDGNRHNTHYTNAKWATIEEAAATANHKKCKPQKKSYEQKTELNDIETQSALMLLDKGYGVADIAKSLHAHECVIMELKYGEKYIKAVP